MELRHLRYFVMAAEERNISRASARLNISQPAVSRQIRDLEGELGVKLFDRGHDGLRLTEAGVTALDHAREVLRQALAMEESMHSFRERGRKVSLKVGYIPTALPGYLAAGLRRFNRKHPDVCVQIREMTPRSQQKALQSGMIDLALLGAASSAVKKQYCVDAIRKVPLAVAVPVEHALADRKSIKLAELTDEPFVTLEEEFFVGRPRMITKLFEHAGISAAAVLKVHGLSELLGQVGGGAGVALVPADLDQLPHAGVRFIRLQRPAHTLVSSAVWRKENQGEELLALVDELKQ